MSLKVSHPKFTTPSYLFCWTSYSLLYFLQPLLLYFITSLHNKITIMLHTVKTKTSCQVRHTIGNSRNISVIFIICYIRVENIVKQNKIFIHFFSCKLVKICYFNLEVKHLCTLNYYNFILRVKN